jgi:putative ABC transport system substrate-binding protein
MREENTMSGIHHPQNRTGKGWTLLVGAAFVVFSLLLSGCAQKPKVYRVGILTGLEPLYDIADGFKTGMTELGYVEGKNIVYDLQKTKADPAAEKPILQKFVADKVDLIVVWPTEEVLLAQEATQGTNIPVVFLQTNIEGTNLVKSVRAPGGNITGVRYPGPDLAAKRFEILHELVPQAKRFWVPYKKDTPIVAPQLEMLRPIAEKAGVTLVEAPYANGDELIADLAARDKASDIGFDAILLITEPMVKTSAVYPKVNDFAVKHKLPVGGVITPAPGYSALFGVASNNIDMGKLGAQQADKALKGIPVGTIPVLSSENYLQINYKVAQEMGLTVPEDLLLQANQVIR